MSKPSTTAISATPTRYLSLLMVRHRATEKLSTCSDSPNPPSCGRLPAVRSHHVSRVIAASPEAVYEYASNVENLPRWAAGLAQAEIVQDGDVLLVESPMGRVKVRFVEQNRFGVLDHDVTLPTGTVVTNPVRVLSHPNGAEVIFTVRQIELDDDEFARDIDMVAGDLERLEGQISAQN